MIHFQRLAAGALVFILIDLAAVVVTTATWLVICVTGCILGVGPLAGPLGGAFWRGCILALTLVNVCYLTGSSVVNVGEREE